MEGARSSNKQILHAQQSKTRKSDFSFHIQQLKLYNFLCFNWHHRERVERGRRAIKEVSIDKTVQSITEVRAGNNNRSSVAIYRQHSTGTLCSGFCLSLSLSDCLCLRLPLTDSHKYEGHKEKQSGKNYVLHMPMTTTTPTTQCPSSFAIQCRPSSIDITNCGICFCACTLPGQRLMECLKCRQFRFVLAVLSQSQSPSGRHFLALHLDSSFKCG